MKKSFFLDTSYVSALLNTKDEFHLSAKNLTEKILSPIITTEAVLTEIANSLFVFFATDAHRRTQTDIRKRNAP